MQKFKKLSSLFLSICLLLIPSFNTYADSLYQNSSELVDYQNATDINSTNVYAQVEEDYLITIPKVIVLDGTERAASYEVSVCGDIAGSSIICVEPDKTFILNEESGNKDFVIANIEQDKLTWKYNEILEPNQIKANGFISASDLTAGKWSGNFNFNINLSSVLGDVIEPQQLDEINILSTNNKQIELFDGQSDNLLVTYCGIDVTNKVLYESDSDVITVDEHGVIDTTNANPGDEANITITYSVSNSNIKYRTNSHVDVKKCEHVYNILVDSKKPDCENSGYEIYKCSVCNVEKHNKTNVLNALGHKNSDIVVENKVNPTCTETGSYENVTYCTVCGKETSRNKIIVPATGHVNSSPTIENKIDSTCTQSGTYDNVTYCTICGAETSRNKVTIPATGHTSSAAVKLNVVEPTCLKTGSYQNVVFCKTCNAELSRQTVTTNALGHTFQNGKCIRCGIADAKPCVRLTTYSISDTGATMRVDYGKVDGNGNFSIEKTHFQHYGPGSSVNYYGFVNLYYPDHGTGWYARILTNVYYSSNPKSIIYAANAVNVWHWTWTQWVTYYIIQR